MSALVTHEREGDVGLVTIDRPEKLNALNDAVFRQLEAAFEELGEVRVVVLRTAGDRAFVAGADLGGFDEMDSQTEFREFLRLQNRVNDYVESHPAVVVAAVDGLAYGGGFELVLATDVVVAAPEAEFALPELSRGFVPGGGGTQRLPRVVGPHKAKEMLTTGAAVDAEEGKRLGLVCRIAEDVDAAARDLAEEVLSNAPLAVTEAKRLVNEGRDASLDAAMAHEQAVAAYLYTTEDVSEGVRAFVEKRDPEFEGR